MVVDHHFPGEEQGLILLPDLVAEILLNVVFPLEEPGQQPFDLSMGHHPSIRGVRIGKEETYIFSVGVPPCSLVCSRMEEAPLQCSANQTTRWNTTGKVVGFFLSNTFYFVEGCTDMPSILPPYLFPIISL